MNAKQISDLFYNIGMNPSYKGYPYLIYIVGLAVGYYGKPFPCMKDLYREAADHFHVSPSIITDDIRTLLRNYWNQNHSGVFSEVLNYPVQSRLSIKEFVAVVAEYLSRHS